MSCRFDLRWVSMDLVEAGRRMARAVKRVIGGKADVPAAQAEEAPSMGFLARRAVAWAQALRNRLTDKAADRRARETLAALMAEQAAERGEAPKPVCEPAPPKPRAETAPETVRERARVCYVPKDFALLSVREVMTQICDDLSSVAAYLGDADEVARIEQARAVLVKALDREAAILEITTRKPFDLIAAIAAHRAGGGDTARPLLD
jgi:hypothetical protein